MQHSKGENKLLKNFFSQSLLQVANNLLPIISIPIIVRIIGPDKFGVINFVTTVMTYFILLTNYGFDLTATRAVALNKDNIAARSEIFNIVLFSKLFLFGISSILFVVLLQFMPQLYEEKAVAIYSFFIVFSFVLTPAWLYQGMQQLYKMAVFNFITKLLFTLAVLFVIREKEDYVWQPFMIGVAHILVGVCAFFWAIKNFNISLSFVSFRKILKHLWDERIIFFSFVAINIYVNASQLILGLVRTSEDVAFFSAAFRLVIIMHTIVTTPLSMALFPYIGESFGRSKEEGIERVRTTTPLVVYICVLMGVGVWVMAPFIITIFYGDAFQPAISVLRILCFLPLALGISNMLGVQTMVNLKMDRAYTNIIMVGSTFGVGVNWWLAKEYNYTGAAWALLLTEFFLAGILWWFLKQKNISPLSSGYFHPKYVLTTITPMLQSIKQTFGKKKVIQPQAPIID